MDPQSVVEMLEPLREPAPVGWWPPAPGWWLLAVLMVIACVLVVRLLLQRARRRAPVRAARLELTELRAMTLSPGETATRLAVLLRRAGAAVDPGADVATAIGEGWISALNGLIGNSDACLGRELGTLAYRPDVTRAQVEEALAQCEAWLGQLERRA